MHRVGNWLGRGKAHSSTQSLNSLEESQNLESALRAVELIMDDDIEGAEAGLASGNSAFHSLCKGVLGFMKATLGFEQEIMKEASEQLSTAESSAYNNHYKAQRDSQAFRSTIYDRGAEFSLCQAEAQIMSAVIGVLNESLTESIKGFYKLRKAYMTLDSLMQMENAFLKTHSMASLTSSRPHSSESLVSVNSQNSAGNVNTTSSTTVTNQDGAHANRPSGLRQAEAADDENGSQSDSEEFFEVENENPITKAYTGHLEKETEDATMTEKLKDIAILDSTRPNTASSVPPIQHQSPTALQLLSADPSSEIFKNPLDVFIHSGVNLCFGLLSLMISAIPPAFGKLLFVIGFRGDRERGMRMLWQASKFSNINGGLAGLIILGWYNGLVGFCDIIPDPDPTVTDEVEGYPAQRLQELLMEMRRRYPKSQLWLVEEARMAASHRNLDRALELLEGAGKSSLKQLKALHMFEKGLSSMHAHRYEQIATCFLACVELNSWSQALYYYIAGAAHLTIYRDLNSQPDRKEEAMKHAQIAEEYFKTAPTKGGKKKVMGRQLPFDAFVIRKIAKWTHRSDTWNCSFADAVGVSPLEEMIFFWNGYKKMDAKNLELALQNLAWSESPANPHWTREELDEHAILALLRAVVLRNLRRHKEAKDLLSKEILSHPATEFKGHNRDDWTPPTAHYEMAVNLWMERKEYTQHYGSGIVHPDSTGVAVSEADIQSDAKLVRESKGHIEKARGWEKYELEARVGMKVTAGGDAIKKWEEKHGVK